MDNKFQGDERSNDSVGFKEDAQLWGSQCQHKPIQVCGPVFADDARWMANSRVGIMQAAVISEDFLGFPWRTQQYTKIGPYIRHMGGYNG